MTLHNRYIVIKKRRYPFRIPSSKIKNFHPFVTHIDVPPGITDSLFLNTSIGVNIFNEILKKNKASSIATNTMQKDAPDQQKLKHFNNIFHKSHLFYTKTLKNLRKYNKHKTQAFFRAYKLLHAANFLLLKYILSLLNLWASLSKDEAFIKKRSSQYRMR